MFRRAFLAGLTAPGLALAQLPSPSVIEQAWFGPADRSHGHDSLGTGRYPGCVHAAVRSNGRHHTVALELPDDAAFEDGVVRLVDIDADSSPEILLVRASRSNGAALSILGVEARAGAPLLVERARSPSVGAGRWLNPVGAADFDGDGRLEVVAVLTPHIGGVLTLYRYQPPDLMPIAQERGVSNHVYGDQEQQLAVVVMRKRRMTVAIPDQARRHLRFLAPTPGGAWESVVSDVAFAQSISRVWSSDGRRVQVRSGSQTWSID